MKNEFYVYIFRDPLDQTPIYVGKGKGSRAVSHLRDNARTNDRLGKLISSRTKLGLLVEPEIIAHCNEQNALLIEQSLIKYFGRAELGTGPLFNSTDGGDGVSNPSERVRSQQQAAQEKRWGTKSHNFINAFTGEEFSGKLTELATKLGVSQRAVHKLFNNENIHSVAGWCLAGNEHLVNAYNVQYDFKNALTGELFKGTIADLEKHSGRSSSGLSMMVNGKSKHAAGWILSKNEGELRPLEINSLGNIREIEFPWENPKAGFDSFLAWASMPLFIQVWREELDGDKSIGIKSVLKKMNKDYPKKMYLYERAFKRCREGEFELETNKYFLEFFDGFLNDHPELRESLEFRS